MTVAYVSMDLCSFSAMAQTESTDSISMLDLDEIVIEAPKVIRKSDMDVYHPSKSAVENSRNGLQLLNNLMIPTLDVNDALGSIQAAGESVQVRINGQVASIEQLRTLMPESIKRVEWIDNPGLRYGETKHVLNFIISNPTAGGSFQGQIRPALNEAWGNYLANVKFNTGYSQWEISASCKLTENIKIYRDYRETFTYPDGKSVSRTETPRGGELDNTRPYYSASYSYIKPDTTVFVAQLTNRQNLNNKMEYNGLMSVSNGNNDILLTERLGDRGNYPSLSLYLQQNLPNKQTLVIDFNTSLYFGHSWSDYIEEQPETGKYFTDIHTSIKDKNQAYALEANYIKNKRNGRVTAGASYIAYRNRSQYENLDGKIFHQRQDKVYLFAEYYHRFSKWSVTAGMGVQYTDFMFKESDQGTHSWSMRPQATITYLLNQNHNFRLNFTSWQTAPSLEETNTVPQQLDGFQWRVGNQHLKTANSYALTFRYGFIVPRVNGSFGIRAFTSPNAITPLLLWEGEKLLTTYENSRGLANLSFFLAPQIEIVPKWLTASGYLQYRMERMRGTGYSHHNNSWSGTASLQFMHCGFVLSARYVRTQKDLWGEKISWGESFNTIDLNYNWKSWQFGTGIIMPFGKYDQGSKLLSKWNRNEQYMRLNMRIPYISIAYNTQWGRQKHSARKLIEVDANADRSTAGGR